MAKVRLILLNGFRTIGVKWRFTMGNNAKWQYGHGQFVVTWWCILCKSTALVFLALHLVVIDTGWFPPLFTWINCSFVVTAGDSWWLISWSTDKQISGEILRMLDIALLIVYKTGLVHVGWLVVGKLLFCKVLYSSAWEKMSNRWQLTNFGPLVGSYATWKATAGAGESQNAKRKSHHRRSARTAWLPRWGALPYESTSQRWGGRDFWNRQPAVVYW